MQFLEVYNNNIIAWQFSWLGRLSDNGGTKLCPEVMEQDLQDKAQVQEEAQAEVPAEDKGECRGTGPGQDLPGTASVQPAETECRISKELPVMILNARNAASRWWENNLHSGIQFSQEDPGQDDRTVKLKKRFFLFNQIYQGHMVTNDLQVEFYMICSFLKPWTILSPISARKETSLSIPNSYRNKSWKNWKVISSIPGRVSWP